MPGQDVVIDDPPRAFRGRGDIAEPPFPVFAERICDVVQYKVAVFGLFPHPVFALPHRKNADTGIFRSLFPEHPASPRQPERSQEGRFGRFAPPFIIGVIIIPAFYDLPMKIVLPVKHLQLVSGKNDDAAPVRKVTVVFLPPRVLIGPHDILGEEQHVDRHAGKNIDIVPVQPIPKPHHGELKPAEPFVTDARRDHAQRHETDVEDHAVVQALKEGTRARRRLGIDPLEGKAADRGIDDIQHAVEPARHIGDGRRPQNSQTHAHACRERNDDDRRVHGKAAMREPLPASEIDIHRREIQRRNAQDSRDHTPNHFHPSSVHRSARTPLSSLYHAPALPFTKEANLPFCSIRRSNSIYPRSVVRSAFSASHVSSSSGVNFSGSRP